jgi:gluconokinase
MKPPSPDTSATSPPRNPTVLVVMGVSGAGKSTVGRLLAERLQWDFSEGDDMHMAANVAKMSAGVALTDDDRWPWIETLAGWINEHVSTVRPRIITCSSLKRSYRSRMAGPSVAFVHLTLPKGDLAERLTSRTDHFMPASLLPSQLGALEPLAAEEIGVSVEAKRRPSELVDDITAYLNLRAVQPQLGVD